MADVEGKVQSRITMKGERKMLHKKRTGKHVKKAAAICLLVLLVLAGCVLSTSAAAEHYSWTVNVSATGTDTIGITAKNSGTRSDTFGSYITVYNNKEYTRGNAYVLHNGNRIGKKQYILYANIPSHPTLTFGEVPYGYSQHCYNNTYGGFKSSVETYQYY